MANLPVTPRLRACLMGCCADQGRPRMGGRFACACGRGGGQSAIARSSDEAFTIRDIQFDDPKIGIKLAPFFEKLR
jgi:hypothetical protein